MDTEKQLGVEALLEKLNQITDTMEQENLPLSEMMALFKEGKSLEKQIREQLDLAEKQIEILSVQEDAEEGSNG